ncbi:putative tRNA (uracil-O(2)-)-methyltransferase-like, partial [Tropilaelaps mercedesae]
RNCTQVDRSLVDRIVARVACHLLNSSGKPQFNGFDIGGQLSLPEVVALVDKAERSHLKSQCGGLQTLLKNNYHIFQVKSGNVRLRIPEDSSTISVQGPMRQRRACWFNENHPQGCPLTREKCRFAH